MKHSASIVGFVFIVACGTTNSGTKDSAEHETAVIAQAAATAAFPLRVSANNRYLVDQAGNPFRLQIDAAWVMGAHAPDADIATYLSGIKSLGFTGFILMNIVHAGGQGWPNLNEPADFYRNQPFLVADRLDTPNDVYFNRVSGIIDRALAQGLAVELFHTYVGASGGGDGWESVISNTHNTDTVCFNWGVYLARKFPQPNIIWMHGGDHTLSGTALTRFQRIVAGIQSVSRNRISGSEWNSPDTIATDQPGFTYGPDPATSDMQVNSFYGAGPNSNGRTYLTAERAYSNTPTLPAYIEEPGYVDAWYFPLNSRSQIRGQYHWSQTAGATAGGVFGEAKRWDWQAGALASLSRASTLDMSRSHAFYQSIPWYSMRPSGTAPNHAGRDLIVSGAGSGDTLITAALTSTGSHLIAYVPPARGGATTFAVDLRSMAGTSRARWWNPTSGGLTDITGGAYSLPNTAAAQSFSTPGDNGTGTYDWMLVLDSQGAAGNAAPTVAAAASASPSSVTRTTTAVSVGGTDDGGEPALVYTWSTEGTPPAAVTFSPNGTNAAKQSTASFTKAGAYTLRATIKDVQGATATSSTLVTVTQNASSVVVSPASVTLAPAAGAQFAATARDQFGASISGSTFTWTATGGSVTSAGFYSAGSTPGNFSIFARTEAREGTAAISISNGQTMILGDSTVLPIEDSSNANLVVAQRVTLFSTATLKSLSFYVTQAAGKLRLGIFDASGAQGNPGVKLAESAELTPVVGWNTANVTSTRVLTPGNYWLAYAPSSNALQFRRNDTGSCRYFSQPYGVLPSSFASAPSALATHWSFYASLTP